MTQTYLTDLENTLLFHDFIRDFHEAPEAYLYGNDGLPFTDNEMILLSAQDTYYYFVLNEMSSLHCFLRKQQFAIGIFMLFCTTSLLSLFCMLSATSRRRSEMNELEMTNDMEERETMVEKNDTEKTGKEDPSTRTSVIPLTAKKRGEPNKTAG